VAEVGPTLLFIGFNIFVKEGYFGYEDFEADNLEDFIDTLNIHTNVK
jgi:hypothetical protein